MTTISTSGNVNITINENKGLSFWDYLLLQNLFGSKPQPIIINNAPAATYSAPPQEKKEAEKPDKPIDYLVNRQFGIAIFQLVFGLASLIGSRACISQSEVFFPLLINTFICLGSACLFYHERNNTLKTEVEPYMKLAKLLIKEHISSNQNFSHSSAPNQATPPYSPHPSAPSL